MQYGRFGTYSIEQLKQVIQSHHNRATMWAARDSYMAEVARFIAEEASRELRRRGVSVPRR